MKRSGLSLIEILIAMAVLTILVTAVAYAVSGMMNITRDSRITSAAADYTQAVVERYRNHWRDPSNYYNATTQTYSQPDITDLGAKLDSSYTVTINPSGMLNPDGTTFTQTTSPPARRLIVTVEKPAGRIRAQLSTIIGSR